MVSEQPAIVDCHQHFYDGRRFPYPVLQARSEGLEALLGDYSALPRVYLPADYARDTQGLNIAQTVWVEFLSQDPAGEIQWAKKLVDTIGRPTGMIARVDFLDPHLNQVLDEYGSIGHIRCVRQHLGWHPTNPALRFANRPDFLSDAAWRGGIAAIRGRGWACELELYSPQLPQLLPVVAAYPDLQFVLPVMGWPLDLTEDGFRNWRHSLIALSACSNVTVKIFAMECIFGIRWTVPQVRPWILETIEIFGPSRCMFASHMPLCTLACSLQQLYSAYFEITASFSASEKRQLLHDTAAKVYRLP